VHAIGDLANRDALDGFEAAADEWRPLGLRQRIEHAQLLGEGDVSRFGSLGVAASVQFSHAPSDRDIADEYWAGMTDRAYTFRSLLETGAVVANGSDAPVEELDPLLGVRAGVLRTLDEREPWHPEQAITIEDALRTSTVTPAWLAGDGIAIEDDEIRELPRHEPSAPPLVACDPSELAEIQVVATMLGGRWVFGGPPFH
jgi:predicted amidohydrolase YtcJ